MGSQEIWNLGYRQGFAFIGVFGSEGGCLEKRALNVGDQVSVECLLKLDVGGEEAAESSVDVIEHAAVVEEGNSGLGFESCLAEAQKA